MDADGKDSTIVLKDSEPAFGNADPKAAGEGMSDARKWAQDRVNEKAETVSEEAKV